MSVKTNPEKIVWAVDPFSHDYLLLSRMAKVLAAWSPGARIEPVYVVSSAQLGVSARLYSQAIGSRLDAIRERLSEQVAQFCLAGITQSTVITCPKETLRGAARTLQEFALDNGATLIAVTSRSQSGVKRLVLGSFAESLVLQARVPLLITTPKTRPVEAIENILFATDLSPASSRAFPRVLELAARHRAKLLLLHASQFLSEHGEAAFGPPESYSDLLAIDKAEKRRLLGELAEQCCENGLASEVLFIEEQEDPATVILKAAKKLKSTIVALVSQKEGLDVPLLGSVTRKVVRRSSLPVWVIHEHVELA